MTVFLIFFNVDKLFLKPLNKTMPQILKGSNHYKKVKYLNDFLYLDSPVNKLRIIETVGIKKQIKARCNPSLPSVSKSI